MRRKAYAAHWTGFLDACGLGETIEAREERGGHGDAKPWLVYIDGEVWRDSRGVGRRFATKEAAERAARCRSPETT